MTSFVINAVKPVMVKTVKPWRCLGTQVRFRETGAADGSKKPRRMGWPRCVVLVATAHPWPLSEQIPAEGVTTQRDHDEPGPWIETVM